MRLILCAVLIALIELTSFQAMASSGELERAQEAAAVGDFQQAFRLLEPLEFEMSGLRKFDLLFALSALETGRTGLAMLAIDRVLAQDATDHTARFLLARTHFILNDLDGARREFEELLKLKPEPVLGNGIGLYLDAISVRDQRSKTNWSGYIEFGLGHDTNVTGGSENDLIFVPGLNREVTLVGNNREEDDEYANLAGGFDAVHLFNKKHNIYLGGYLALRGHRDLDDQDYQYSSLRFGYRYLWHNQSIRFGLSTSQWELDDENYQDSEQVELEWSNTFARRSQISVAAWQTRYRYQQMIDESLDYDDSHLRFSYTRLLGEQGDKLVSAALELGEQDDINNRADGNQDNYRIVLTAEMVLESNLNGFLSISAQESEYDRVNQLFTEKRSESQYGLTVGVIWTVGKATSLRTAISHYETDSNFELYDGSSTDFSISLKRYF